MAGNPLVDIWKIKDLRDRIFFTLMILVVFRLGTIIPIPGVDFNALASLSGGGGEGSNSFFEYLNFFSGGAFKNNGIFLLGIMPYISTSIILQLLLLVFPSLKRISEQEGGKRKIQRYTRYGTVLVAIVQSFLFAMSIKLVSDVDGPSYISPILAGNPFLFRTLVVLTVTTGTMFLVWLGEQINQRGVGNGISLLIFAGIVARMPEAISALVVWVQTGSGANLVFLVVLFLLFVGIIALVIYEQQGQRKIPVHYAKRIVGRKMVAAQNQYIPFKINPSGVIPVIFAGSVLGFLGFVPDALVNMDFTWAGWLRDALTWDHPVYNVLYGVLIVFFAYFYTQVQLNPIEISRQIRENGGSIPGIRSEKMEEYLVTILNRIVLPGSIFLAFIAIIPTIIVLLFGVPQQTAMLMGGTSLLIMVGVDLDTMSQIEGHLRMHHHDGLTKKGRLRSRSL
jgi:preprotein translocase subunit SecY